MHGGPAAASPSALHRLEDLPLRAHKPLLLLRRQLDHASRLVRISESRKDLTVAHAKIRMLHVRALVRLRKTQSQAPKLFRGHDYLQLRVNDNILMLMSALPRED